MSINKIVSKAENKVNKVNETVNEVNETVNEVNINKTVNSNNVPGRLYQKCPESLIGKRSIFNRIFSYEGFASGKYEYPIRIYDRRVGRLIYGNEVYNNKFQLVSGSSFKIDEDSGTYIIGTSCRRFEIQYCPDLYYDLLKDVDYQYHHRELLLPIFPGDIVWVQNKSLEKEGHISPVFAFETSEGINNTDNNIPKLKVFSRPFARKLASNSSTQHFKMFRMLNRENFDGGIRLLGNIYDWHLHKLLGGNKESEDMISWLC